MTATTSNAANNHPEENPLLESWVIAARATEASAALANELTLPEHIARLLICRGFDTPEAARAFLHPSINQLHDPYAMLGMATAVVRLRIALLTAEPILIYGDYDVDGTVATVLLKTALERTAAALGVLGGHPLPHPTPHPRGLRHLRRPVSKPQPPRACAWSYQSTTGIRAFTAGRRGHAPQP